MGVQQITINFVLGQGMKHWPPSCEYTFNQKEKIKENGKKTFKWSKNVQKSDDLVNIQVGSEFRGKLKEILNINSSIGEAPSWYVINMVHMVCYPKRMKLYIGENDWNCGMILTTPGFNEFWALPRIHFHYFHPHCLEKEFCLDSTNLPPLGNWELVLISEDLFPFLTSHSPEKNIYN